MNVSLSVLVVAILFCVIVADKSHREAWKAWKAELDKLPFADKLHECMKNKRSEHGGGHGGDHKKWREKWENMTEEEREAAKAKFAARRTDPEHRKKFAEFREKMHQSFQECWESSGGTGAPPEPPKFNSSRK